MADRGTAKKPKFKLPKGYDSEAAFLQEMRELLAEDQGADYENQKAGVEDLQFLIGDQWPAEVKAQREQQRKPTLTINRLPAFVAQVIGARKQNETQIKIIPDVGGAKPVAKVREGLIRSIQKVSRAGQAYDTAFFGTVAAGIGNWQIDTEYESDEVWDQCLKIHAIPDHFSVVWDRMLVEPTGRDATRCFVLDRMTAKDFEDAYPWATPADVALQSFATTPEIYSTWYTKQDVRIVAYWRMRSEKRLLALLKDGSTVDITDQQDDPALLDQIAQRPDGSPYIREAERKYAEKYLCSGLDILAGPVRLPIDRIPVFRVPAWEVRIGDISYRWGLIRHMKDPQRLHNFWRSSIAEKIRRSPKATWLAADTAVSGREAEWRASADNDDPLLIYNAESGQVPQRNAPIQLEDALITEAALTTQDLKDVSNIHEANLGMPSNEVSGKAIVERKSVSNTGTAIYHDNLRMAIEETGRVLNELIPYVYDAPRVVRVVGEDDQEALVAVNRVTGGEDGNRIDLSQGRYAVTAVTGRSYATKREESAESMMALAQAMPQVFSVASDLIVGAMDWPDADKIAARLRRALPPNLLGPEEMTDEQRQMLVQQSQQAQLADQLAIQREGSEILKKQSESMLDIARAGKYAADAALAGPKADADAAAKESAIRSRTLRDSLAVVDMATKGT